MIGPNSMHETEYSKPVHFNNPEEGDGEGDGNGLQDGGHMIPSSDIFIWLAVL